MKHRLFILSGPSTSGKSTIEKELADCGLVRAISYTTRPKRENESDDAYHFISKEYFDHLADQGFFAESTVFDTKCYGMSRRELKECMEKGNTVIVADPVGAMQLRTWAQRENYEAVNFLLTASHDVIVARLTDRDSASDRLSHYIENERDWEERYRTLWDHIIRTDDLSVDEAVDAIMEVISENDVVEDLEEVYSPSYEVLG